MQEKKSNHYVPQLYLKNFSEKHSDGKYKLYRLTIDSNHVDKNEPKRFACIEYFYDHNLENWFMKKESQWSKVNEKIIKRKTIEKLTDIERNQYSKFLGYLLARTEYYRNRAYNMARIVIAGQSASNPNEFFKEKNKQLFSGILKALPQLFASVIEENNWEDQYRVYCKEINEVMVKIYNKVNEVKVSGVIQKDFAIDINHSSLIDKIKEVHIEKIHEIARIICNAIIQMRWVVLENKTNKLFIASDNPVCVLTKSLFVNNIYFSKSKDVFAKNHTSDLAELFRHLFSLKGDVDWLLPDGKINPDIIILFPISANLVLLGINTKDALKDKICITDEAAIEYYNMLITAQANKYIFSKDGTFYPLDINIQLKNVWKMFESISLSE